MNTLNEAVKQWQSGDTQAGNEAYAQAVKLGGRVINSWLTKINGWGHPRTMDDMEQLIPDIFMKCLAGWECGRASFGTYFTNSVSNECKNYVKKMVRPKHYRVELGLDALYNISSDDCSPSELACIWEEIAEKTEKTEKTEQTEKTKSNTKEKSPK